MSDFTRESWLTKIQALLAKAERAGSEEEASAFFAKAQELITKWEIDDAELAMAKPAHQVTYDVAVRIVNLSTYTPEADMRAINLVALAMGLRAAYNRYRKPTRWDKGQKPEAHLYGVADDLDRFEMMWASITIQMITEMKREEGRRALDRNQQRSFRMGFKIGYAERIAERIKGQREATIGTSLVLRGKADAVATKFEAATHARRKSNIQVSADGIQAGRKAANSADLGGKRVSTPTPKGIKA
jgi:hypothetical protein